MGTPNKYSTEYCQKAAEVLKNGESLAAVCAELGISRSTLHVWRENHPEFKESLDEGLQQAQRKWESLGMSGIMGDLPKFSAPAWIFTMKNRFRADYAEEAKEDKNEGAVSILEKLITGQLKVKND